MYKKEKNESHFNYSMSSIVVINRLYIVIKFNKK